MPNPQRQLRQHLHADALIATLRQRLAALPDTRVAPTYSLADTLMAGFALFALKDPSLLAFDKRRQDPHSNLRTIYGIERIPCDSQLWDELRHLFHAFVFPTMAALWEALVRGIDKQPPILLDDS
jgi:hypothetical protein